MSMVSPFSIDTFFPSFRSMQEEFGVTGLQMQQTLTFYLLPYAFMSLFQGPISDAVGRKPVLLTGLALYALASLACSFAPSFGTLLVFRTMQGLCAGVGMVVSRAVVRDLYQGAVAQRLMSVMTMIFGFAPAVAPIIGGWIHVVSGWRAVFGFMTFASLLLLLACHLRLPETHPPEKRIALDMKTLVMGSWSVLSDRVFLLLAASAALSISAMLVYVASAPAIVLDHWHLGATQFAWLFIPMISGMVSGAFVSGRLAGRMSAKRQVLLGMLVELGVTAISTASQVFVPDLPVLAQQVALVGVAFGFQISAPVLSLAMLDRFPHVRGTASSVQGFCMLIVTTAVMGLVAPLLYASMALIAGFGVVAVAMSFALWWLAMNTGPADSRYQPQ